MLKCHQDRFILWSVNMTYVGIIVSILVILYGTWNGFRLAPVVSDGFSKNTPSPTAMFGSQACLS